LLFFFFRLMTIECVEKRRLTIVSLSILEIIARNFVDSTLILSHLRERITLIKLLDLLNSYLQTRTEENVAGN
jgi:hypothetical protein